jgi:hypothetical protein
MDAALRPARFQTDAEWRTWKHEYQVAYNQTNKERKLLVSRGELPKRYRTHTKKRRI